MATPYTSTPLPMGYQSPDKRRRRRIGDNEVGKGVGGGGWGEEDLPPDSKVTEKSRRLSLNLLNSMTCN